MSEEYFSKNPYMGMGGNPIKLIDPDGMVKRDQNGNIIVDKTGKSGQDQIDGTITKNKDGTETLTYTEINYDYANIYADDGTAIDVTITTSVKIVTGTVVGYDNNGNPPLDASSINKTDAATRSDKNDFVSDCHGLTFGDNQIWINDNQVDKLLKHDNYKNTSESTADIAIFRKNNSVVHSAVRNANGTYNDNAGYLTTKYNRSLSDASRGLTDITKSGNVQFLKKKSSDKMIYDNGGKVSNGLRIFE